jgi:asparagine synthetase B (glutamine-hydrolysing)
MCGIVGAISNQNIVPNLIEGLSRLEYRGYDSSGIAVLRNGIERVRSVGRVAEIETMVKEKILVIGASGQIGVELTLALRKIYGNNNVIASDLREENPLLKGTGPYVSMDVMNKEMLHDPRAQERSPCRIYVLVPLGAGTPYTHRQTNPRSTCHT